MLMEKDVDRLRHGDVSVGVHSGTKVGVDSLFAGGDGRGRVVCATKVALDNRDSCKPRVRQCPRCRLQRRDFYLG